MNRILCFFALSTVLLAVGCHKPAEEPDNKPEPLDGPDTTYVIFKLVAPAYTSSPKTLLNGLAVEWETGDNIYINGSSGINRAAVRLDAQGGATAALSPSVRPDGGRYYAIYPGGYPMDNPFYYGQADFTISLPAEVTIPQGSLNAPMAGVADSGNVIHFENLCALVELEYTYGAPDTVVINDMDGGSLAGTFVASCADSGWSMAPVGNGTSVITVVNQSSRRTIYIPVPPGQHKLSIALQSMSAPVDMKAGVIYHFDMGEAGKLPGTFSVSSGTTVQFSQGNLRYQASTGKWRFANRQYDVVGAGNSNVSSTYSGWIDLFAWGTSGWNSGAGTYQPYDLNSDGSSYSPGGLPSADLTGDYANADWGVYNAISNGGNTPGLWRTLTHDEWVYLLNTRSASTVGGTADARYAKASVGGIYGLMLLPDSYSHPSTVPQLLNINVATSSFSDNAYTETEWLSLEQAGAVFLPVAGRRLGGNFQDANEARYWSSTHYESLLAYATLFFSGNVNPNLTQQRQFGFSVRLVSR